MCRTPRSSSPTAVTDCAASVAISCGDLVSAAARNHPCSADPVVPRCLRAARAIGTCGRYIAVSQAQRAFFLVLTLITVSRPVYIMSGQVRPKNTMFCAALLLYIHILFGLID